MAPERLVRRLQHEGQGVELIPERLRLDRQTLACHDPRLALQRQMIEVLAGGDLDGEVRRVAPAAPVGARREAQRPGRRVDATVARTPIFLAPVGGVDEAPLDERDLLGVLCPFISVSVPPHCGHVRSASRSSCATSTVGSAGCAAAARTRR